jgi:hypothetical protein
VFEHRIRIAMPLSDCTWVPLVRARADLRRDFKTNVMGFSKAAAKYPVPRG